MPPSPWSASTSTATTFWLCVGDLRAPRRRSLSGTRTKPGTSGSKPACTLRLPVADSVASVRPWQAFSITMIAGSATPLLVAVVARELDRGLVRLRRRSCRRTPRPCRRARRSGRRALLLRRDLVEVRGVDELRRLLGDRAHEPRVAVAERVHRDAGERVEVRLPARPTATRPRRARTRPAAGRRCS